MKELKQEEDQQEDPTTKPVINAKNWPKTLEGVNDYIDGFLGVTGAPLSYITRTDADVKPANDDPEDDYDTEHEQMVAHMPHTDDGDPTAWYVTDNRKVYDLIHAIFHENEHWIYIKPFQQKKGGRGAYQAIWNHYLGPNNIDHMATEAERLLDTANYTGEKRSWNFEKYVRLQKEQHSIINGLRQYGHTGIAKRSEVRYLNKGIKCNTLDVPRSQILASAALRSDFDGCVQLYMDFLKQNAALQPVPTHNISQFDTSKPKAGKTRDETVDDQYYTSQEYKTLTPGQKQALKKKMDGRDSGPNPRKRVKFEPKPGQQSWQKDIKTMNRNISALLAAAALPATTRKDSDDDSEGDSPTPAALPGGNRTNDALTRQRRGK
jgi:hypothetical protein